jgi:hypothetical protein
VTGAGLSIHRILVYILVEPSTLMPTAPSNLAAVFMRPFILTECHCPGLNAGSGFSDFVFSHIECPAVPVGLAILAYSGC